MNKLRLSLVAATLASTLFAGAVQAQTAAPAKVEGGMLVGANGMTLYTFDNDANGKSACNGPCAANWLPLMTKEGDQASGDWSIVARDNGARQWAYRSKPLYFWSKDQKAGDKTGDGFKGLWHVAR